MSLYDAQQPSKSIDLLTEVILNSNRTVFCHYFMECGKKATKQTNLNDKQINVCDDHYKENN
ncbi:MAG: hypothetical protein OEM77_07520 [Nitrosopumilus sp.]|nr:hypothetical protein [Nitrosopumilus sp.]MDH3737118.1 hypothetical protein [Nitrosopumilus sp.]MDH3835011.1 hypothetical protein [Nitrosopumilus sp.]